MLHTQHPALMDRTHADGMWFSSWENPCSCFRLDEGKEANSCQYEPFHRKFTGRPPSSKKKCFFLCFNVPVRFCSFTFSFFPIVCLPTHRSMLAAAPQPVLSTDPKSSSSQNIYESERTYFASASEWKPNHAVVFADSSIKVHLGVLRETIDWLPVGWLMALKEHVFVQRWISLNYHFPSPPPARRALCHLF